MAIWTVLTIILCESPGCSWILCIVHANACARNDGGGVGGLATGGFACIVLAGDGVGLFELGAGAGEDVGMEAGGVNFTRRGDAD